MNGIVANIELLLMDFLLLGVLFFFNLRHWRPTIINPLSTIYLLTMAGCLLEIAAFCVDGHQDLIWLNYLSNILYLSCINVIGSCMLAYSSSQFPKPIWKTRKQSCLVYLPSILGLLALASAPFTGLIFGVDAQGYYYRAGTFFLQMIPYGYLLVSTGYGIYWFIRSETTKERNMFLAIAGFAVPPIVLGGIQVMVKANSLDIMMFSITLALVANYAVSQDSRITRDTLTRLPNREVLDMVLHEKMHNNRRDEPEDLFVLMGDLDGFKSINDTYGHLEGDRALILAADQLYGISRSYKATAARFGGDEFVMVVEAVSDEVPRQIIREVNERLMQVSVNEKFHLHMSIGFTRYCQNDTIHDILKAADRELYLAKRAYKAG